MCARVFGIPQACRIDLPIFFSVVSICHGAFVSLFLWYWLRAHAISFIPCMSMKITGSSSTISERCRWDCIAAHEKGRRSPVRVLALWGKNAPMNSFYDKLMPLTSRASFSFWILIAKRSGCSCTKEVSSRSRTRKQNRAQTPTTMAAANRISSMVKASFLADFATMPLHWIYDQNAIAAKVGDGSGLFFSPPSCPFYNYPAGVLSPYGDESLPLLRSISNEGGFHREAAAEEMFQFFQSYPLEGSKGYVGRLNHAPKSFVAAREAGAAWEDCAQDDFQSNGIAKVPLIVAQYAGHSDLELHTESMVRILQTPSISVECSLLVAKILARIALTGEIPRDAMRALLTNAEENRLSSFQRHALALISSPARTNEWVDYWNQLEAAALTQGDAARAQRIRQAVLTALLHHGDLTRAIEAASLSAEDASFAKEICREESRVGLSSRRTPAIKTAAAFGLSCALPSSLLVSLLVMQETNSWEEAISLNILIGGDNCSRAMIVGAAFGASDLGAWAHDGPQRVHKELWQEIVERAERIASTHTDK